MRCIFLCVSPSGNINNDNYNYNDNGVRPYWLNVRQSRHQPKSIHQIKRTHDLSAMRINKKLKVSYGAYKNHISHGNCYRLGQAMDGIIRKELDNGRHASNPNGEQP